MKHCLISFVSLLGISLCSSTPTLAEDFEKSVFTSSENRELRYSIMVPEKVENGKKYPLVVTLHGVGGRGAKDWERNCYANAVLAKPEMRKKYPCFVVAPTVNQPAKWAGDPLDDLFELIEQIQTKHPIDLDRTYVTGQSMGGFGSFEAIVARPKFFAAAVPVCGGNKPENAAKIVNVPLWVFHGAKDRSVPVTRSQEMIAALKKAGGEPKYSEFPDVKHNAWYPAYDDQELWKWLFAQKRAAPEAKPSE